MTQPATGDIWPNIYGYNTGSIKKALTGSLLLRDGDGVNTSLAFVEEDGVWQSGFTPLAEDGRLRTDLLVENGGSWYDCGGGTTDGPQFTNSLDIQKDHIWQTRQVVRTDVTSEEGTAQFGMAEFSTLSDTLEMDLPLVSTPVRGTPGYARKRPLETLGRIRQAIFIGRDKNEELFIDIFPNLSIENIDDRQWNAENLIATSLTWGIQIDPHSGYSHARFRGGSGWESNPGVPVFSAAPVATAIASTSVTLVFPAPASPATPLTYTATKTVVSTGVVSALPLGAPTGTTTITVTGTGLTVGSQYTAQIIATDSVGGSSMSAPSNAFTAIS